MTKLRDMIPDSGPISSSSSRPDRALVSFMGNLIKGLTGMPSEDDLAMMTNGINGLKKEVYSVVGRLSATMEGQATFMKLLSQKEKGLSKMLRAHDIRLTNLTDAFIRNGNAENEAVILITAVLKHLIKYDNFREEVERIADSIKALINGFLTPDLIKPDILNHTIKDLNRALALRRQLYRDFLVLNSIILQRGQRNKGLLAEIMDRVRDGLQNEDDLEKLTYMRMRFPAVIEDIGIHYTNDAKWKTSGNISNPTRPDGMMTMKIRPTGRGDPPGHNRHVF